MTVQQIQAQYNLSPEELSLALAAAGELSNLRHPMTPDWLSSGAALRYDDRLRELTNVVGGGHAERLAEALYAAL